VDPPQESGSPENLNTIVWLVTAIAAFAISHLQDGTDISRLDLPHVPFSCYIIAAIPQSTVISEGN
jgi:hypothetical protein